MELLKNPPRHLFFTGKGGVGKTSVACATSIALADKGLRVLLVTLPEATPVHEAAQLQKDLERADIHPFAWVINQSLLPLAVTDPVLVQRRSQETRYHQEVAALAQRVAVVAWRA